MILGLGIDSWITIATLVALMAALLFTRLRTDVVFWGVIGILFVTGVLDKSEAFSENHRTDPVIFFQNICLPIVYEQ